QDAGVSGFLHPEGIYDDPKGGKFREAVYPRLKGHFQFQNELNLFAEVDHHAKFSINIFSTPIENKITYHHLANLYAPSTVDKCFEHSGFGPVPGIKDDNNKWNTKGHKERVIQCTQEELALFARLYDAEGTPPLAARLPAVHSTQIVEVLRKFAEHPRRLGDLKGEYYSTVMWDETNAVKKTHTIKRHTCFPRDASQWILSGPHFFVGNPFYKTPRTKCTQNSHYDILDLTTLPDDYLPRTNYVPDCDAEEYRRRTPRFRTKDGEMVVTDCYRFVNRRMFGTSSEHSFISAIVPQKAGHINTAVSTVFSDVMILISFAGLSFSLVYDFFLKSTGKSDLYGNGLDVFPYLTNKSIQLRTLMLSSLTSYYSQLWGDCWQNKFLNDKWAKSDSRLPNSFFTDL
ncbi:MAG TPA: hypothetical protein VJ946_05855, partial [Bacteroidales bacterium]|nr:hypothetical protein [Bacteroidales bacterium]